MKESEVRRCKVSYTWLTAYRARMMCDDEESGEKPSQASMEMHETFLCFGEVD